MGLRSLPFFKAKKGWQVAGGGLSADGGSLPIATTTTLGGVRVGRGLNIDNDGTLSISTFPLPSNITNVGVLEYTNVSISSSWLLLGNVGYGNIIPYVAIAYSKNSERIASSLMYNLRILSSDGGLYIKASDSYSPGLWDTLYVYYIEKEV